MNHHLLLCIVNPPSQDILWTSLVPKQLKINLLNHAWRICSSTNQFQKEVSFYQTHSSSEWLSITILNSLVHKFNLIKLIGSAKEVQFGSQPKNAFLKSSIQGNENTVFKTQLHRLCLTSSFVKTQHRLFSF